jgi:MFS superfamily sulfate permease-like transporter
LDSRHISWTDGDAVAHETSSAGTPGRTGNRYQIPWNELRGTEMREFVMSGVVVVVTVALFLGGVVTGVIAAVALAIRREDRRYTLVREAPDRISRSARRLTGVGRRGLDAEFFPIARELAHQRR